MWPHVAQRLEEMAARLEGRVAGVSADAPLGRDQALDVLDALALRNIAAEMRRL